MAYYNTGFARRKILKVTKGDYNMEYNICSAFPPGNPQWDALSDEQFAQLSEQQYAARLSAFCNYVYGEEDGLQADCPDLTAGSVVYDTVACPLPDSTKI